MLSAQTGDYPTIHRLLLAVFHGLSARRAQYEAGGHTNLAVPCFPHITSGNHHGTIYHLATFENQWKISKNHTVPQPKSVRVIGYVRNGRRKAKKEPDHHQDDRELR